MDGRGFFLGLIAAVVLFLLWKKESGPAMSFTFPGIGPQPGNGAGGGCAGCSGGPGGCAGCGEGQPSYSASPAAQNALVTQGTSGQVSPGTPPLQSIVGSGSFYAASGPTPDSSFTNYPGKPVSTALTVARSYNPSVTGSNVRSSPTTPANIVPTRAVGVVPGYSGLGSFQQRFNVAGVPRPVLSKLGYIQ